MKKLILIITLPLIFIGGIFLYQSKPLNTNPQPTSKPQNQISTAQIKVEFPESSVSATLDVSGEDTAFSLLQQVAQKNNLELQTKQYDFGVFVESIGEYESGADMSWIYFVDGQSGSVAADQYKVEPDQLVEWKYIKPNGEE